LSEDFAKAIGKAVQEALRGRIGKGAPVDLQDVLGGQE
jgi:hypothetical protein